MAARDVIKSFNLFVDGQGLAGQVEELNPPKLSMKTDEFRAGGMNAPVKLNLGQEVMECDFSLIAFDRATLALWGVAQGEQVPLVFRMALESYDGTVTAVVHTMRGRITEIDQGTSKAGDKPSLKFMFSPTYYKLVHGGQTIHEIDVPNMVRIVNGVDVLAAQRAALGI